MSSSVLEVGRKSVSAEVAESVVPWSQAASQPWMPARALRRAADYLELTKPRIGMMALVTVAVGFFMASSGEPNSILLTHTLLGAACVAAGSSVLNQVLERDTDSLMRRTQKRPLPAGRVGLVEAWALGSLLSAAGISYLSVVVNPLTGLLGAITLGLYVFAYTPLKSRTSFNTLVGAIPGALPPVMGWAAVRNALDFQAWSLFLILFLWQFPHFLAIAWIYRSDYARAGLKMLPVLDRGGGITARQTIAYSLALLPASLVPTVVGLTGPSYFFGALCLGAGLLGSAIWFAIRVSEASARWLMRASLVYLAGLLALMVWNLAV